VSGQRHAPAALYSRERTSELVGTQRLQEKSFASAGDRTPVVQSVKVNEFHNTPIEAQGGEEV
jgi:hypothetical protein